MKKEYLKDMEYTKILELFEKNKKLEDVFRDHLIEMNMELQSDDITLILGNNWEKYIEYHNNYNSFYLTLKNYNKFIDNLDTDYLTDEQTHNVNKIKKDIETLYNTENDEEYYELDDKIEKKCEKLLKDIENMLHRYEDYPNTKDICEYACDLELLDNYYIEIQNDGTSDNIVKKDVSYVEEFV